MPRKLAIKRLTASDLTFFGWQYRNNPSSKQKAINLNADIFIEALYPGLRNPALQDRFPVDIFIYGPGLEGEYNLQRKIVKTLGAKNWRLNGEIVENPEDSPERFNALTVNDLAIFDFSGEIVPVSLKLLFIAASVPEDTKLQSALDQLLGDKSMLALSATQLDKIINEVNPKSEHPIYGFALDTDLLNPDIEDIALGGNQGRAKLTSRSYSRKMSRAELQKAKESADFVGLQGEQYVNDYLLMLKADGSIHNFEWISDKNAISSYDFRISLSDMTPILIDVKSTQGEFERTLHISLSELLRMKEGPERYDIYRVFDIKEETAQLRIAENVGEWANNIIQAFEGLPSEITVDSISCYPRILHFGPAITLKIEKQLEEE
ncbi:MAG TPA: DUF3883 domain-containing protein [Ktedonobacteraceae bacterium]|jgi:hypothetical protein|nr:DUF3883 domain-containing protein [Ktedonobacteraceae bacterium]